MANIRSCTVAVLFLLLCLAPVSSEEQVHVMQRGETIYTLAGKYDVAADAIIDYNSISDPTRLAVGTRIRIPGTYVVQQGEYILSIARKLDVNWLELLAVNGLDRDDPIFPGNVLLVPWQVDAIAASADPQTTDPAGSDDATPADASPADAPRVAAGSSWPHPGEREAWDGKFPGIVMHGDVGDDFVSVAPGVVVFVGPYSSFGKLILVRSANGYLYGYAGADRVHVATGDRVEKGAVLGTVGFLPAFDSAMVLFTVWRNNRYVDPETAPRG